MIIHFDIIIKIQKGMLFCVNIQQSISETNGASIDISKDMAYKVLGHSGEEATTTIAKELN